MPDIIIKNGYILNDTKQKDIVIENGIISEIVDKSLKSADTVIDAKGCRILPGLVNTHTHAAMSLFRGYADDLHLKEWLENYMWPIESHLTEKDVYAGTNLAILEMIKTGTTCFLDMYFNMDSAAKAVEESGIRAALSYGMIELWDKSKGDSELKSGTQFINKWDGKANGRITCFYGPHAPNTCSKEFLSKVKDEAIKNDKGIHIHVLETESELNQMKEMHGKCSINMLDEIGFFEPTIIAAHCVWISDGDIKILKQNEVTVSHNPISNMKLASGISPIPKLLENGVNVSIGTDGCASNNNLNMFEEMKFAALLHKVNSMNSIVLPAKTVFDMATINGANALSVNSGKIKIGANADIILIDMKKPNLTPMYDIYSHAVYSANGSEVKTTIVDGKVLMDDYKVLCMDEYSVMEDAIKVSERLVSSVSVEK